MLGDLIPMVVMTGMFAMIFGIVYVRSRENMAMVEKGLNPRMKDSRPRPFVNLKWGLLLIGSGCGLLFAYIIDHTIIKHDEYTAAHTSISIGGYHGEGESSNGGISIGGYHADKRKVVAVADTSHAAKDTSLSASASAKNDNANTDDDGDDEDDRNVTRINNREPENPALYFALVAIGGGLGLFFSYRIEKKEWLDKKIEG